MVAAARVSELVEIVDHMLAGVRQSVLPSPFRASTAPDVRAAADAAAQSAKDNAEAALAMLHVRAAAYFPLADAARDILIALASLDGFSRTRQEEEPGNCFF